jgi:NAD+ kinase
LEQDKKFDAKSILAKDPSFERRLKFWDNQLCAHAPQTFDIVIALGGDGTVLYASWLFQRIVPPVLSFALGSLGFLTKFDFEGYSDSLSAIFSTGFNVNLRLRFEATVMRSRDDRPEEREESKRRDVVEELIGEESENDHTHFPDGSYHILNEVVLDRGPSGSMFHPSFAFCGVSSQEGRLLT